MKTVFVSYNEGIDFEKNTALRLQTISSLYGFGTELPSRLAQIRLSTETKKRIDRAAFVLALSVSPLGDLQAEELNYAISRNKPIIVFYDQNLGKTIRFGQNSNVKEVFFDFLNTENINHQIAEFLRSRIKTATKTERENVSGGIALTSILIGLLGLWALSRD